MRKSVGVGIAVVCGAVLAGAGYAVYDLTGGGEAVAASGSTQAAKPPRTVLATPPTATQAAAGARAFLDAWSSGDLQKAAALTDDPTAAATALAAFRDKVKPSSVVFTSSASAATPAASPSPQASTASGQPGAVPFHAAVQFTQPAAPWQWDGALGMEAMSDGTAAVHWAPSVINPQLKPGTSISVQPLAAPAAGVVDRNGKSLAGLPSLAPLMGLLKAAGPTPPPADAGSAVEITDDSGKGTPVTLFTITQPKPQPVLKLTLDATLQAAAESAVQQQSQGGTRPAALVAIEPSTGNILAFANAPSGGLNMAFLGATAPGSTMKVVTATALLEAGDTPETTVACPSQTTVTGLPLHNDFTDARPNYKLQDDFAQSCNTAFINESTRLLKPPTLPSVAKDVFGLGLVWKTGIPSFDTSIPLTTDTADAATEYIGQGKVVTNPLAMASVAATVQSGTFRQPILVPGLPQVQATRQLSANVLTELRSMMNYTTHTGTASAIPGIPGDVGSKTGTAEVNGKTANSWFTAYRGNLAVACEVEGADFGAQSAGPAAVQLLKIGNN